MTILENKTIEKKLICTFLIHKSFVILLGLEYKISSVKENIRDDGEEN